LDVGHGFNEALDTGGWQEAGTAHQLASSERRITVPEMAELAFVKHMSMI